MTASTGALSIIRVLRECMQHRPSSPATFVTRYSANRQWLQLARPQPTDPAPCKPVLLLYTGEGNQLCSSARHAALILHTHATMQPRVLARCYRAGLRSQPCWRSSTCGHAGWALIMLPARSHLYTYGAHESIRDVRVTAGWPHCFQAAPTRHGSTAGRMRTVLLCVQYAYLLTYWRCAVSPCHE